MGNMWKTERTFGKNLGKHVDTHEICTNIHQPLHRRWSLTKSCRSWSTRWHSRTVTWQQSGETPMGQKFVKELNMHRYGPYGFLLLISANSIPPQKNLETLLASLQGFYKKAAAFVLRAVAKHSAPLAQAVAAHNIHRGNAIRSCSRNKCKVGPNPVTL